MHVVSGIVFIRRHIESRNKERDTMSKGQVIGIGISVAIGAVIMLQIMFPNVDVFAIAFAAFIVGLLVFAAVQNEMWVLAIVGVVAGIIALIIAAVGFSAFLGNLYGWIADWIHSWPRWPTPQAPSAEQVWQYQNITWPIGLYVLLIAIGNVVTWRSLGGEKIASVAITAIATLIGALFLFRFWIWIIGFGLGVGAWAILFFTGLLPKPTAGATPLVMASAGLGYSLISVLVVPMQGMLGVAFHGDPTSGIVAVMGFSAAAGIIKLFGE